MPKKTPGKSIRKTPPREKWPLADNRARTASALRIDQLPKEKLVYFITKIREWFCLVPDLAYTPADSDKPDHFRFDPDKDLNGCDTIDRVNELMDQLGVKPSEDPPF